MRVSLRSVAGGVAAAALAGGFLLGLAGSASAAAPSFEPDPASQGSVNFYDAGGHRITSGLITDNPLAAYFGASGGALNAGDTNAYIAYATPQDGVPTLSWTTVETWSAPTAFGSAVAHPGDLAGSANAIAKSGAADGALDVHIAAFPNASAANPGIYQVRLYTSGTNTTTYYSTDILVSGSSWTQVFPAPVTTTISAITATPTSPAASGTTSVSLAATLSASDASHPAGTVHLFNGTTDLGAATFNAATGAISASATVADGGSYSYTFVYTPPVGAAASSATSAALAYSVRNPIQNTTTAVTVTPPASGLANDPATVDVTVTAPVGTPVGTVTLTDSLAGNIGSGTLSGTGTFSVTTTALGAGSHTVSASFAPTDPAAFNASSGSAAAFTLNPKGYTVQANGSVTTTVDAGTLMISTIYTDSLHAFDLGHLQLDANAKYLTATKHFGTVTGTGATAVNNNDAVTVTDTRAGDIQWTASIGASDFKSGANIIDSTGLGWTSITPGYVTGNAISAANAPTITNLPAHVPGTADTNTGLKGAPKQFATILHGVGTVSFGGDFTLNAPTSTLAGAYAADLTYTVI